MGSTIRFGMRAHAVVALVLVTGCGGARGNGGGTITTSGISVYHAVAFDYTRQLLSVPRDRRTVGSRAGETSATPAGNDAVLRLTGTTWWTDLLTSARVTAWAKVIEQRLRGTRPAATLIASFGGLGAGFDGPPDTSTLGLAAPMSLSVGPNHVVQTAGPRIAIFTKQGAVYDTSGKVVYAAAVGNAMFAGFGATCETGTVDAAVARYDQLAGRWVFVLSVSRREARQPQPSYAVCYAITDGTDPFGPYHRYEFPRPVSPATPRLALWPDGYYLTTTSVDTVIHRHVCAADRVRMLRGQNATEQCVTFDGAAALASADLDGPGVPPPAAPHLVFAFGDARIADRREDDGVSTFALHVDWDAPANTTVSGPTTTAVAPFRSLCATPPIACIARRTIDERVNASLDVLAEPFLARMVYRSIGGRESVVAVHAIPTASGASGIRWYEFRLDARRVPVLFQEGTFVPDGLSRWMGSPAMDAHGDIGIGYSAGGPPATAGLRFAARLAADQLGTLTLREALLVDGHVLPAPSSAAQRGAASAMDPSDDCTVWFAGVSDRADAARASISSRIGAFRLPGCPAATQLGAK
jgi:hypothetical protein